MKPLAYHPGLEQDVIEALEFYESRVAGLGRRFHEGYRAAIERIYQNPSTGTPFERQTRMFRIRGFPYGVIFRECPDRISIVALHHFSRRPNYWIDRLEEA